MKTILSILIGLLLSLQVAGQDTGDVFLGHWTNPETNTSMVVYKDVYDRYQVKQWSLEDGEMYNITDVVVTSKAMTFSRFNSETKTTINSKFYKQGDDDMEEYFTGPTAVPLIIDWIRETPSL
ncbi:MAG: hypothetical protein M0D57_03190 [Sphingobacteriales bacterium JAD_PAG50586_3]|nr:MAG: hypothetical protein M0D57_03190 [Sphingobacteriales bacterium JAD_PAG50586_3]